MTQDTIFSKIWMCGTIALMYYYVGTRFFAKETNCRIEKMSSEYRYGRFCRTYFKNSYLKIPILRVKKCYF